MYFDYIDNQMYEQMDLQVMDEDKYYKLISKPKSTTIPHIGYRHTHYYMR